MPSCWRVAATCFQWSLCTVRWCLCRDIEHWRLSGRVLPDLRLQPGYLHQFTTLPHLSPDVFRRTASARKVLLVHLEYVVFRREHQNDMKRHVGQGQEGTPHQVIYMGVSVEGAHQKTDGSQ